MQSVLPRLRNGGVSHCTFHDEELVKNAIAWQLLPDSEPSCDDVANPSPQHSSPSFSCSTLVCDNPHCPTRGLAETWPWCSVQYCSLPVPSPSNVSRPFLSLMLPEWVHEKAEEDEAVGIFRCTSLASFTASPTSSGASSPASSCPSSPAVPSAVGEPLRRLATPRARRSGVCWADLDEAEDDGSPVTSTVSTATSSPIPKSSRVSGEHGTDPMTNTVAIGSRTHNSQKNSLVGAFAH